MLPTTKDVRIADTDASSYVTSLSINVLVGSALGVKKFSVHEDLVRPRSEFFAKAMIGPWREAEERKVDLPEDEPEVFALYLKLLYANALPVKTDCTPAEAQVAIGREYSLLSKLYVLAEKLMDDKASSTVLAAISSRSKEKGVDGQLYYPNVESIRTIYNGTVEGVPMREALVDMYTTFGSEKFIIEPVESVPKDFLYDLSRNLLSQRPLRHVHEAARNEIATLKTRLTTKTEQAARKDDTIVTLRSGKALMEKDLKRARKNSAYYQELWSSTSMAEVKAELGISTAELGISAAELRLSNTIAQVSDLKVRLEKLLPSYAPPHSLPHHQQLEY